MDNRPRWTNRVKFYYWEVVFFFYLCYATIAKPSERSTPEPPRERDPETVDAVLSALASQQLIVH